MGAAHRIPGRGIVRKKPARAPVSNSPEHALEHFPEKWHRFFVENAIN
jgi:hypothetical protein